MADHTDDVQIQMELLNSLITKIQQLNNPTFSDLKKMVGHF